MPSSRIPFVLVQSVLTSMVFLSSGAMSGPVDIAAAEALAKSSNCSKCHSVDKKKDGPSFKIDGVEEEHQIVKTKDDAAIKNLVQYILSR